MQYAFFLALLLFGSYPGENGNAAQKKRRGSLLFYSYGESVLGGSQL